MKQNGTDKQQVTHMSGAAIFPDYSPDGSEIVFAAQPAGATARNIYVVPSDGGTPQQLTTVGNNVYPAFSPDGSKIVFTSNRTGTSQVYVMNADGSGQTQLTFDPQPKDQVPDWSPDGSKIAYLADTHGISDVVTPSWGDIWVMNADGSGQHPITNGASWYGTAWSPDGTRIATLDFPSRTVYTVNAADGSDVEAVHPAPASSSSPAGNPRHRAVRARRTSAIRPDANARLDHQKARISSSARSRPTPTGKEKTDEWQGAHAHPHHHRFGVRSCGRSPRDSRPGRPPASVSTRNSHSRPSDDDDQGHNL